MKDLDSQKLAGSAVQDSIDSLLYANRWPTPEWKGFGRPTLGVYPAPVELKWDSGSPIPSADPEAAISRLKAENYDLRQQVRDLGFRVGVAEEAVKVMSDWYYNVDCGILFTTAMDAYESVKKSIAGLDKWKRL